MTYDRTYELSGHISPLKTYLAQVPGIANRVRVSALCRDTRCSFSLFDKKQFELYVDSEGKEGTAIVHRTALTPNTEQVLNIDPDEDHRSFKTRFKGPLFVVVRNLGLEPTDVKGTVHYVALVQGRMIAVGTLVLVICFLSCITVCVGLPICYMNYQNEKRLKHQALSPASAANGEQHYIQAPSPVSNNYGSMFSHQQPPTPSIFTRDYVNYSQEVQE